MRPISRRAMLAMAMPPMALPPEARGPIRVPFRAVGGGAVARSEVKIGINGKPAAVRQLLDPTSDLFLLLVLDFSGDLSLVDPARQAILRRIGELPANSRVALMRFQDGLRVAVDPTKTRDDLTAAIEGVTIAARPGLLTSMESVQELADSIAARARVRVAALMVSDSNVTEYQEDYTNPVVNSSDAGDMSRRFPEGLINEKLRQMTARLRHGETPMYLVHLQYLSDRLNTAYQSGLMELIRATGGEAEFCRSIADIPNAVYRAFDAITGSQYLAEVDWAGNRSGTLDVVVKAGDREIHSRARRQFSTKGK